MSLSRKADRALRAMLAEPESSDAYSRISRFVDFMRSAGPSSRPGIMAVLLRALQSSEALVRERAAEAFWLAHFDVMSALLHASDDSDMDECQLYAAAREQIGGVATVQGLCGLLNDSNLKVRHRAISALAAIKASEAVPPLLVMLNDADPRIRSTVVCKLAQFEDKAVLCGLIEAMRDPDANVRFQAVQSLCLLRCPGDLAAAEGSVGALQNPDRAGCFFFLVHAPTLARVHGAVGQLLVLLRDPDCAIRLKAADALGLIGDAAAVEQLLAALRNEISSEVRRSICRALWGIATAAAKTAQSAAEVADAVLKMVPSALRKVCEEDPSLIVRVQAIEVLEGLEGEYNTEPKAEHLSDPLQLSKKMLGKAIAARKQLGTFCLVGEILKEHQRETFVIAWMTQQLRERDCPIRYTTLRDHLSAVKELFESYSPDLCDLWTTGARGYKIIKAKWWKAWQIAMETLKRKMPDDAGWQTIKKLTDDS